VGGEGDVRVVLPTALHVVVGGAPGADPLADTGDAAAAPVSGMLRGLAAGEPGTRLELAALGSLDDGLGGRAHFTLSLASFAGTLPDVAALRAAGTPDARAVTLPCGPAVVATSWEEVALPGLDGTLLGRFDVHVRHARPGRVLLLSIATTGVHVWDSASELAAAVACSLEFGSFAGAPAGAGNRAGTAAPTR